MSCILPGYSIASCQRLTPPVTPLHGIQAERSCSKLEEEVHVLQGQLQAQDADLAELHLKCQSAERRAADSTPSSSFPSGQGGATATAAGTASKAMQTSTRNLLLAQVSALPVPQSCFSPALQLVLRL